MFLVVVMVNVDFGIMVEEFVWVVSVYDFKFVLVKCGNVVYDGLLFDWFVFCCYDNLIDFVCIGILC